VLSITEYVAITSRKTKVRVGMVDGSRVSCHTHVGQKAEFNSNAEESRQQITAKCMLKQQSARSGQCEC